MKILIHILFTSLLTLSYSSFISAQSEETNRNYNKSYSEWFWELLFGEKEADWDNNDQYNNITRQIDLTGYWRFTIGDKPEYSTSDLNDSEWEKIVVPADWEEEGFNGYDGFAWYRTSFDGRLLDKNKTHFLLLGFIDDVDETFLNGKMVGKSGAMPPRFRTAYNSARKYIISNDDINFYGDNVLAIRVYDDYRNGGLVNGEIGVYASESKDELLQNLYGTWKFMRNDNEKYLDPEYDDKNWEYLLVPSNWDNQGYHSFDGIAWYRKRFNLTFIPDQGKIYYLVLGKIDDFDITYLNGVLIGKTIDRDGAHQQMRIYKIPQGLLNIEGDNVIAIQVNDTGYDGGMYEGPVGIIEDDDLTRIIRISR